MRRGRACLGHRLADALSCADPFGQRHGVRGLWIAASSGLPFAASRSLIRVSVESSFSSAQSSLRVKRTYRLYGEEGLSILQSLIRWRACRYRSGRADAEGMNDVWAIDFLSDKLFDGRPFRILTIVDCHTREALATSARTNFRAYQVVEELDRITRQRGTPRSIRVDHGPEFAGRLLDQWAYLNKVEIDFSRPGKPPDNAFIEAFTSRLRQECLL